MDGARFDRWTKRFGAAGSRRRLLAGAAALALGTTARPQPAALALGTAARPRPAATCDHCSSADGHGQGCPAGCGVAEDCNPTPPCTCYDDQTRYCADDATGLVCDNNQTPCRNRAGTAIGCADRPDQCCGDVMCSFGHFCASADDDMCCALGWVVCWDPGFQEWVCLSPPATCPCAVPCGGACCGEGETCCGGNTCCTADEVCDNGTCRPAGCQASQRRRVGPQAGVCCSPTQLACLDHCCSDGETCCERPASQDNTIPAVAVCCPKKKQCCVGVEGATCCDPGEAYCCGGACCAKHRVCVGTGTDLRCLDDCPNDGVKCGTRCCGNDQICIGPETCASCDQGETPCGGKTCCAVDQVCKKGKCAKCKANETACGADCCNADQHCENGKCVRNCPKGQDSCAGSCCDKGLVCKDGACVKKHKK